MISSAELSLVGLTAVMTYFIFAVVLSLYDYRTGLLPDKLTLSLLWLGLLFHTLIHPDRLDSAVYGAVSGYLSLWLLYWGYFWISHKQGLGYGDFKLLAAIGAWNGWQSLPLVLVIASSTGVMAFLMLGVIRRRTPEQLPFGPCLALAGWGEYLCQVQ